MGSSKRILSVGQCGFDNPRIRSMLEGITEIEFVTSDSQSESLSLIKSQPFDLILVNRILDETGESGHEVIRKVLELYPSSKLMLVSNYQEAQDEAVRLGAIEGFGKNSLGKSEVINRLRAALDQG